MLKSGELYGALARSASGSEQKASLAGYDAVGLLPRSSYANILLAVARCNEKPTATPRICLYYLCP